MSSLEIEIEMIMTKLRVCLEAYEQTHREKFLDFAERYIKELKSARENREDFLPE